MEPEQFCQNCWHMIQEGGPACCCKPTPAEATAENLLALIRDLQRQIDDIRDE